MIPFLENPWIRKVSILVYFVFIAGFTYFNGIRGVKLDEHYVALGGLYISKGLVPHLDFFIPNGALVYYLQSIGPLLFNDLGLAYTFPACLVSLISFGVLATLFKKLNLNFFELGFCSIIYLFTFFGAAGALWYNALATLFITFSICISITSIIDHKDLNLKQCFIIAFCFSGALFCKLDVAVLGIIIFALPRFILKKDFNKVVWVTLGTLTSFLIYFVLFQFLGADLFSTMNFGQRGFDSRLDLSNASFSKFVTTLIGFDFRIVFICSLATFFLPSKQPHLKFIRITQFLVALSALTVLFTSGVGAGFVSSHFSLLSAILLILHIKNNSKLSYYITYATLLISCMWLYKIYHYNYSPKYNYEKHPHFTYMASKESLKTLEAIQNTINKHNTPVNLYSSFKYWSFSDHVSLESSSKHLWDHLGTTINKEKSKEHYQMFITDPPDLLVENHFPNYSYFNAFGEFESQIREFINQHYKISYRGQLELTGTGGGLKRHDITIYSKTTP